MASKRAMTLGVPPVDTGRRGGREGGPSPSSTLSIAVTLPPAGGGLGITKRVAPMSQSSIAEVAPSEAAVTQALGELERLGFRVSRRGRVSVSVRGSRSTFERAFGTQLSVFEPSESTAGRYAADAFFFPPPDAPWQPRASLLELIDDAYIQWPHIYMAASPIPPQVDYHHLRVPGDLTLVLNADRAHRAGVTGAGVRVAMVDSGFAFGHPYYQERGYNVSTVLAPGAARTDVDGNGHGTGEAANLLAVAPDVNFVGVKLDNETNPGQSASVLEGFQEALTHNPDVISISLGFDLVEAGNDRQHLAGLPNNLKALEAEIEAAVADGIVVVFAAGNGHAAFPAMMPDVIAAGGTYVDADQQRIASDYASAFASRIYHGRHVPDCTGLVGMADNGAAYIMLPVPSGCDIDRDGAPDDGTAADDAWGVFSGTSAAAPQLAGLCALLLSQDPQLTPADVKAVLRQTARDVTTGHASAASNEGTALSAAAGADGATGAGLVDAFAAVQNV